MSASIFKSAADEQAVHALYRQVLDGWPTPKTELRVPTREGETFVVASGPEHAPPLVLLHGSQANASTWMFDMALWSRRFRCYAVDMIGEAGFSPPSRPPLESEAHTLWLDDVMAGLDLAKASFVGVSLGGWLALDYAKRRPAAIDRMALVCPGGIGRQKDFRLRAAPLLLLGGWGRARMREMVLGRHNGEPPPAARPFVELMGLIGRTIHPRGVRLPCLSDAELERLTMPMLVIVGGKDVLIDSADTRRRLAKSAPHAEVVFLPEGRHFLPGHASRILAFLEGDRSA